MMKLRLLLRLFLSLEPCGVLKGAELAPRIGGTLRFDLASNITSLNPLQQTVSVTKNVASIAFECLLTSDENGVLKPALAASWEVSRDGLHCTFKLRKAVRFHNSKEMTAEGVVFRPPRTAFSRI